MKIHTIGFTGKTAEEFFESLKDHSIELLVDIRANNTGPFAVFTRHQDLPYFLDKLLGADYVHEPRLAPTKELIKSYRYNLNSYSKDKLWIPYAAEFREMKAQEGNKILEDWPDQKVPRKYSAELKAHCEAKFWEDYEQVFLELMKERAVENHIPKDWFRKPTVLLCSEPTPENCHRRLAVEYLERAWGEIESIHL